MTFFITKCASTLTNIIACIILHVDVINMSLSTVHCVELQQTLFFNFSYKNGSLTREKVRDETSLSAISEKWPQVKMKQRGSEVWQEGKQSWDVFNQLLDITPRGNFGNLGKC